MIRLRRLARIAPACLVLGLWGSAIASAESIYENFESEPRTLDPDVPGLRLEVLGGDELLELRNRTGRSVVVQGYDNEPYLKLQPSGVVERNRRSAATYLNADRGGTQPVPSAASGRNRPSWEVVSRRGAFRWYDHRIHLTVKRIPRRLERATSKTEVLDWEIPLRVGNRPVRAKGTLYWVPDGRSEGGVSTPFVIAAAAVGVLIVASLIGISLRRVRRPSAREGSATEEAW